MAGGTRCPNFIERIGGNALTPGQSFGDRLVKNKRENGAAPEEPGVESWREEKNEGREPNEVLYANPGRENEKDDPSISHRIPEATAFNLAAPPGQDEGRCNNEELASRHHKSLPGSETEKNSRD